jgi:sugar lactone lactonase YvrE
MAANTIDAGSATVHAASPSRLKLSEPWGLAATSDGVYIADSAADRILKVSSSGKLLSSWGRPGTNPGAFRSPRALVLDRKGNLYIGDDGNRRIQELDGNGKPVASWNRGIPSFAYEGTAAIGVDSSGQLYVADANLKRVKKYSPAGKQVGHIDVGNISPIGVIVDAHDTVLVVSTSGSMAAAYTALQTYSTHGTRRSLIQLRALDASALAVDGRGNVYVADSVRGDVVKLTLSGQLIARWPVAGYRHGGLLAGIAVDTAGTVYVSDSVYHRVFVLSSTGRMVATWQ